MPTLGAPSPPSSSHAARATGYARAVADRRIPASKWTRLACQRHLDNLAAAVSGSSRWCFDEGRAGAVCRFCELLQHEKGELQGQLVRLEDWQCFLLCSIFGWVDRHTGHRRFREAFLLIPRGNGKSPLAAWIGLWMAFLDGEKGAEVYCGAANQEQAHEVFKVAKAICQMVPALPKRVGIEINAGSLTCPAQRSRFKPVIGKPKDGASIYLAILDELHQQPTAEQYDTFVTGSSKRKNSLILIISTAGSTVEGPCHARQQDVMKVLEGVIEDDSLFGVIYQADEDVDWTTPAALEMANPNLRVSMDTERMFRQQAEAARNAAKQNAFRTKHLNQWTNAAVGWMNMAAWAKCAEPDLRPEQLRGESCWLGSDLASKLDLSATVLLFRRDLGGKPHYYAFCRTYLPEDRVNDPANGHYQRWAALGHLTATPGSSLDYSAVEADTVRDIERWQVQELAYDARYADQYAQRVSEQTGVPRVVIPPSPAELSPAMKELEAAVYDGRFRHDGHPVLTWCISNVMTRETAAGNYTMPDKQRADNKIDAAVALFVAMARAHRMAAAPEFNWSPQVWA